MAPWLLHCMCCVALWGCKVCGESGRTGCFNSGVKLKGMG